MSVIVELEVFVVEDNEAYRKALVHFLKQKEGINVTAFASGEECLRNLAAKPDIIIQDFNLQGINGKSVLLKVKKVLPRTEFIFLSINKHPDNIIDTLKKGAFAYIIKTESAFPEVYQKIEEFKSLLCERRERTRLRRKMMAIAAVVVLILLIVLLVFKR